MASAASSNEKTPLTAGSPPPSDQTKAKIDPTTGRYQRTPLPPHRNSTRTLHISMTLLIMVAVIAYANRQIGKSRGLEVYDVRRNLPDWYGVCSKEGRKVYTVPAEEGGGVGGVECVVVGEKMVQDMGSLARIRRRWGDKATIGGVDASPEHIRKAGGLKIFYIPPGHTMTPGFIDSHGHPLEYGYYLQLPLQGSSSIQEIIHKVEQFVLNNSTNLPKGSWIEGMGWNQNLWPNQSFPTAEDLDSSPILKGLAISLARIDVHAEWVSGKVLELLGELPEEVPGGKILRYPDGRPTGVFLDNAIDLLNAIRPKMNDIQREQYLTRMAQDALSKGLTGMHNAQTKRDEYDFFVKMAKANKLPLRIYSMLHCGEPQHFCGDKISQIHNLQDGRLTIRSVKLFADGALGSRGAALIEPYSDGEDRDWRGLMLMEEEGWEPLIRKWYEAGWQVNVHTIGDRANYIVINAMENILGPEGSHGKEARMRLEHAQIMKPEDLVRAAELGIIGSYQPTHCTSDMWYAEQRLGPERMKGAYAWKSYLQNGGRICLGSDFPVESIDPLKGFYAAISRLSESGESPHGKGGWFPEEKLSREETLRGMTVDGAYASFSNDTGSITVGKRFDAVIWDDDLMNVPVEEMLEVKTKITIIDGKIVWGEVGW